MSTKETLPLPEFLEQCAKQLAELETLRNRLDAAEKELADLKWQNEQNLSVLNQRATDAAAAKGQE